MPLLWLQGRQGFGCLFPALHRLVELAAQSAMTGEKRRVGGTLGGGKARFDFRQGLLQAFDVGLTVGNGLFGTSNLLLVFFPGRSRPTPLSLPVREGSRY